MRFGITNLIPAGDSYAEWKRFNAAAEHAGFDAISVGDIQTRTMEMAVSLALLAATTATVRFGPTISNPVTRHPGVMAGMFASIDHVAPQRCWLGIGTGNSAVKNLGLRSASLKDLEEYVAAFRDLITRGHTSYRGASCVLPWAPEAVPAGVPVYIAANGPRSLQLAGRIADGVIVGGGLTRPVVEHAFQQIALGAASVGKRLDDLDIWFQAHVVITERQEEALVVTKDVLAGAVSRNFRHSFVGKGVPADLESAIRRFEANYDYSAHCVDAGFNAALLDSYGLTQLAADLWLIGGTAETVVERLRDLGALGIRNVHVAGFVPDPFDLVDRFGRTVIPALAS